MTVYWDRQTADKPLFPDLLWSRPENRASAGKLLIIGGNLHGFSAPAEAYAEAIKGGIGTARVLLPDALKKLVGSFIENGEYAASTKVSGSFSKQALAEFIDHSKWADSVLLAGELGRNSETAALLENYVANTDHPITITRDAIDYFFNTPEIILGRQKTCLVLSMAQLQKLATAVSLSTPIKFSMDFMQLIEALHTLSQLYPAVFIVKHLDTIMAACSGQVSTTKVLKELPIWRVKTAAHAAVWTIQNPTKIFEAVSMAVFTIASDQPVDKQPAAQ